MFCINCGKEISERAKFCPFCGSNQVEAEAQPDYETPQGQAPLREDRPVGTEKENHPPKKRGKGLIIGIIAGLLLAAAVVVLLVSGVFAGPSGKVLNAAEKTFDAYIESAGMASDLDLAELAKREEYSANMSLELLNINADMLGVSASEVAFLNGAGVQFSGSTSLKDRKAALSVTPIMGSAELLTAEVIVDDANLYLYAPEILGDTYYGVNTETLGADLAALGLVSGEAEQLGFNIFDLSEEVKQQTEEIAATDESGTAVKDSLQALYETAQIEPLGKETVDVNGYPVNCTAYQVVFTVDALQDFADEIEDILMDIYSGGDMEDLMETMLTGMGLPAELVDEAMNQMPMEDLEYIGEAIDELKLMLEEFGNIEFKAYVSGGYLMAVVYDERIMDTDIEIGAYFGGGKNYADDLSIEIAVDGMEVVTLVSSGNHTAAGGTYTDETVLMIDDGYGPVEIVLERTYETKSGAFTLAVDAMGVEVSVDGALNSSGDNLDLVIDEASLCTYGEEVIAFAMSCSIGDYEPVEVAGDTYLLSDVTEEDLAKLEEQIMSNVFSWAMGMAGSNPDIMDMF